MAADAAELLAIRLEGVGGGMGVSLPGSVAFNPATVAVPELAEVSGRDSVGVTGAGGVSGVERGVTGSDFGGWELVLALLGDCLVPSILGGEYLDEAGLEALERVLLLVLVEGDSTGGCTAPERLSALVVGGCEED